ncbi:hypothetical protein [Mycolicibacterium chlorophenolicum]|uniref:hypothetical protein n=1 Tax=Mycolicibacterium chlorophenolicum TaxID=37916 RepID=UPI001444451D|nr:hypothetical protein [Mycolicibacterium chlorophenolicum]
MAESRRIYATMPARHLHTGDFTVEVRYSVDGAVSGLRDIDSDVVVVGLGPHDDGLALIDRIQHFCRAAVVALDDATLGRCSPIPEPGHSQKQTCSAGEYAAR